MGKPKPSETETWKRAEAIFRQLPAEVQQWLRMQARDTILRMLDRELTRYKGMMGTPPIYFPPDLGIPETFVVARSPKTKKAFARIYSDLPVLVYSRGRWDKASRAQIDDWADTAAIAIASNQSGAGAERVMRHRTARDSRMKYAQFGTEPKDFPLHRMERALEEWSREIDPAWLASEEAKYSGLRVVGVSPSTPAQVGWARDLHLPKAKPLAVGLLLLRRYLSRDPQYDAFRGALYIPPLVAVGEQLPALRTVSGAKDRIVRLPQYNEDQYNGALWELGVAARHVSLGHEVEFLPESPHRKTPDLRLTRRTPSTYIECKRSSVYGDYDIKERAEWHRICDPILKYLRRHRMEVDVEVRFYLPLEEFNAEDVFSVFQDLVPTSVQREAGDERLRLAVRPLPRLERLEHPVSQGSPLAIRALFGVEDPGSADGFSTVIVPKEVSRDGLWLRSVHWRACLRWKSCSFEALNKKARGILRRLVAGAKQIPDGSHGILYLAVQEWRWDDLREIRWAKILEELGSFFHSARIRIPYIFLNRLVTRINDHGGPDIEENSTILIGEKVGDPTEADRLPHCIFTFE